MTFHWPYSNCAPPPPRGCGQKPRLLAMPPGAESLMLNLWEVRILFLILSRVHPRSQSAIPFSSNNNENWVNRSCSERKGWFVSRTTASMQRAGAASGKINTNFLRGYQVQGPDGLFFSALDSVCEPCACDYCPVQLLTLNYLVIFLQQKAFQL